MPARGYSFNGIHHNQRGIFMLRRFIFLLLLSFFAATVFAQVSAPPRDQTQAAVLADISRRTGETVTINSLSSQQWYYGTYDFVRSLGCAAAPASPVTTGNWQRFVFNYRGVDYIYMVSDNLQSLILCNEPSLPTAIPSATATLQGSGQSGSGIAVTATATFVVSDFGNLPTATLAGSGQSGSGFGATATPLCALTPRLRIGLGGRVTPGDANWIHEEATRNSAKIGEIPAGGEFTVMAGPLCDGSARMNYWQIDYDGLVGWTSEGLDGEYWLEPYIASLQAGNVNDAFVPEWANNIPLDSNSLLAFSPQGNLIALASSSTQVDLVDIVENTTVANIILEADIRTLDFQVSGAFLTIGLENGEVHLLEVYPSVSLITVYPHEAAITAVAISYENAIVAVADEAGILSFWSPGFADENLRRIQLPEVAGDLEFSVDNRLLIVRDREGRFITALQAP
jgi:hypothetical protein